MEGEIARNSGMVITADFRGTVVDASSDAIEIEGTDKASLVFAGRIYEYRDRFQNKEIPGGFPGGDGDEKGKYCRVMKSVDVSDEAEVEKVRV